MQMTVDTHTHAWGPPSVDHPWVNDTIVEAVDQFSVPTIFTAEQLVAAMDRLRIDEAVLVGYPITAWTDNWYTISAAAEFDRLSGIVMLDHFADEAVTQAEAALTAPGIIGLRIAPSSPYDRMWRSHDGSQHPTWLDDAIDRTAFWDVVRSTDAIVTISTGFEQLDQVRRLVETYPDLTYLFDGYGPLRAGAPADHVDAFATFADYDTVGVKASHTPFKTADGFPYQEAHDLLHWCLETFGRERVVWGSDFPNVTRHEDDVTYAEAYNWLYHVDGLSQGDRRYLEGDAFKAMLAL